MLTSFFGRGATVGNPLAAARLHTFRCLRALRFSLSPALGIHFRLVLGGAVRAGATVAAALLRLCVLELFLDLHNEFLRIVFPPTINVGIGLSGAASAFILHA